MPHGMHTWWPNRLRPAEGGFRCPGLKPPPHRETWDGSCSECGMGNLLVDQHAPSCSITHPPASVPTQEKPVMSDAFETIARLGPEIDRKQRWIADERKRLGVEPGESLLDALTPSLTPSENQ